MNDAIWTAVMTDRVVVRANGVETGTPPCVQFDDDPPIPLPSHALYLDADNGAAIMQSQAGDCYVVPRHGSVYDAGPTYGTYGVVMGNGVTAWQIDQWSYNVNGAKIAIPPAHVGTSQGFAYVRADTAVEWRDDVMSATRDGVTVMRPIVDGKWLAGQDIHSTRILAHDGVKWYTVCDSAGSPIGPRLRRHADGSCTVALSYPPQVVPSAHFTDYYEILPPLTDVVQLNRPASIAVWCDHNAPSPGHYTLPANGSIPQGPVAEVSYWDGTDIPDSWLLTQPKWRPVSFPCYRIAGETVAAFTARCSSTSSRVRAAGFQVAPTMGLHSGWIGPEPGHRYRTETEVAEGVIAYSRMCRDLGWIFNAAFEAGRADLPDKQPDVLPSAWNYYNAYFAGIPASVTWPTPPKTLDFAEGIKMDVIDGYIKTRDGHYVGAEPGHTDVYRDRTTGGGWEHVKFAPSKNAPGKWNVTLVAANCGLAQTPDGQLQRRPAGTDGAFEQWTIAKMPPALGTIPAFVEYKVGDFGATHPVPEVLFVEKL